MSRRHGCKCNLLQMSVNEMIRHADKKTNDRKIQWSNNSRKGNVNFNAPFSVSCFAHTLFICYLFSFYAYFSCYPVFVSLSLSSICITVSSSPSRTFTLPCLPSYSVSLFQMYFFIPVPCFFRPHPQYFLFAPYLCSVTFAVTTFSFSSDFFMILNMTL